MSSNRSTFVLLALVMVALGLMAWSGLFTQPAPLDVRYDVTTVMPCGASQWMPVSMPPMPMSMLPDLVDHKVICAAILGQAVVR